MRGSIIRGTVRGTVRSIESVQRLSTRLQPDSGQSSAHQPHKQKQKATGQVLTALICAASSAELASLSCAAAIAAILALTCKQKVSIVHLRCAIVLCAIAFGLCCAALVSVVSELASCYTVLH